MSTHNKPIKLQNVDKIVATDGSVLNVSAVANGNINANVSSSGIVETDLGLTMDDTTHSGEIHYEFGGTPAVVSSSADGLGIEVNSTAIDTEYTFDSVSGGGASGISVQGFQTGETLVWNGAAWENSGLIIEEII
jgi:hypothetical protein